MILSGRKPGFSYRKPPIITETTQIMCLVFHLTPRAKCLSSMLNYFDRAQNYLLIEGNLK